MKLLDSSPAGDAIRLRTVHWSVARLSARSKAPDFEFLFAELRTLCWNLLYAFVRSRIVLRALGLDLRQIDGPIGAASALKMSYAGIKNAPAGFLNWAGQNGAVSTESDTEWQALLARE